MLVRFYLLELSTKTIDHSCSEPGSFPSTTNWTSVTSLKLAVVGRGLRCFIYYFNDEKSEEEAVAEQDVEHSFWNYFKSVYKSASE